MIGPGRYPRRQVLPVFVALASTALLFFLSACENPLVVELQQQIDQEVAVQELGNLSVSSVTPANGEQDVPVTATVTIVFSQSMASESLSAAVTIRTGDGTEVTGTATYDAEENALSFAPESVLAPATTYTVVLASDTLESAVGLMLPQDVTYQFTTRAAATIVSVTPGENTTGVGLNRTVTAAFSRDIDADTVTTETFVVSASGSAIDGVVSYDEETKEATFTPENPLSPDVTYEASIISDGLLDADGVALGSGKTWEFTTSPRPVISSVSPADGEQNAPINSTIVVTFDRPMDKDSVEAAVSLATSGGDAVTGTTVYEFDGVDYKATFTPDSPFSAGTNYVITISGAVESAAGVALGSAATFSFTASPRPVVESLSPSDDGTDVPLDAAVVVTFDRAMDAASAEAAVGVAVQGGSDVPGTAAYDDSGGVYTVTFSPEAILDPDTVYDVTVESTAQSATGSTLGTNATYSFTTIYYGPDEIGIDFTYTGTLEVSAERPVYLFAYASPLPTDFGSNPDLYTAALTGTPITQDGRYVFLSDDLPGDGNEYHFVVVHDLNDSFATDKDTEDGSDVQHWIKIGGDGNVVPFNDEFPFEQDDGGSFIIEDGFYVGKDSFKIGLGSEVTIELFNKGPVDADAFEDDDSSSSAYRALSFSSFETARNLHSLDDIDYFKFTPAKTDQYEVRIRETSFDTHVALFATDSDLLTDQNALGQSIGSAARSVADTNVLNAGQTYYVLVSSPAGGLGAYDIGFFYTPPEQDAYEGDDTISNANVLSLGRDNARTHTFDEEEGGSDYDYFEITISEGYDYIVEVDEDPSFFDGGGSAAERGLEFELELKRADGSGVQTSEAYGDGRMYIEDPGDAGYGDPGTYYVRVRNVSSTVGGGDDPVRLTGAYRVTFTYGPDPADQLDDPSTSGLDEYQQFNENATPLTFENAALAGKGLNAIRLRTIYSTEDGTDLEDDVDWFRFSTGESFERYRIIARPAEGADGVEVDFEVYDSTTYDDGIDVHTVPDTNAYVTGGGEWSSDPRVKGGTLRTDSDYGDYWIKVERVDQPDNPTTGGYALVLERVGDDEGDLRDYENPDQQITVWQTDARTNPYFSGGLDETPWIGYDNLDDSGPNFAGRNQLTVETPAATARVLGVRRTIHWTDHSLGTGEPDEEAGSDDVDASADYDFFWFQVPDESDPVTEMDFEFNSDRSYGLPFKATVWVMSSSTFVTDSGDNVITESELSSADSSPTTVIGRYDSSYSSVRATDSVGSAGSLSANDYIFIKVELDDSAPETFTDGDNTYNYNSTGEYYFSFWESDDG